MLVAATLSAVLIPWMTKKSTNLNGTSREKADVQTDPLVPDSKHKSIDEQLEDFTNCDWKQIGFNNGLLRHSEAACTEEIRHITQFFNHLALKKVKELKEALMVAKRDLSQAGPEEYEKYKLAKLNFDHLDEQLTHWEEQRSKDHANDIDSECHFVVQGYLNGYSEGHEKHLKTSGGRNAA